ncbi:hypothetical protein [Actinobacillus vicugnae]|uniref:hypothetical protein n=1 Tax=Actinobacillus vicugnae TaxID=2573093 RepID=UPI00142E9608|nr:hypothetical protein [Actinobacillus vicugnae]
MKKSPFFLILFFTHNLLANDGLKYKRVVSVNNNDIKTLTNCFFIEIPKYFNSFSYFKIDNRYTYEINGNYKHKIVINAFSEKTIVSLLGVNSNEYQIIYDKVFSICEKNGE